MSSSDSDSDLEDYVGRFFEVTSDLSKGSKIGTRHYGLRLPTRGANVVNIMDMRLGRVRNGRPVGDWVVRVDNPHRGANFEHININPEIAGIARDPHIPISSTSLEAARTTGKVLQKANKVLVPAAVAIDTARVGYNAYKDIQNGTTRNTAKAASSVAGGWAGGYGGATGGALIGSAIFPGIGTIVGGVIGGIAGGIGGAQAAEAAVDAAGDHFEWDVEEYKCKKCRRRFKCRKYTDQSRSYCPDCEEA